ncbi:MAG: proline dehydrogenase family protein, partial [Phycisphaerae bacterium]
GDPLKYAMRDLGRCVRIYCPYGDLMPGMGYLIRRLLENTSNDGFLKQGFDERRLYDVLLQDPVAWRPASAPLPQRYYQDTDPEEQPTMFRNASNTNFALEDNRQKMLGALAYVRGEFGRKHVPVINNEPVGSELWEDTINPSNTHEVVGRVALASIAEADSAVKAAQQAFATWRTSSASSRAAMLRRVAERMEVRRFELAATMVLEVGKPWREADADVTEAVDHCRFYADQIEQMDARPRLRNLPGEDNRLVYSPKGVCAVIAPWSFPLAILTGMTTAALAAGNTVVIKPAPQAAVLASKFMELLIEAGLPPGVGNLLPGRGDVVGRHLVAHGSVNLVAFTGSYEVGREIIESGHHQRPGQSFIKKLIVEMGGNNAIIVDDDCDLDGAIEGVMESAFSFAGQKCSSCSRVIVMEGIYDRFTRRLREAAESLIIGQAEEPATIVGPVIDAGARDRIRHVVESARQDATVLAEVRLPDGLQGAFVAPVIFEDVHPSSALAQEEVFGPVLAIMKASSFDAALALANDSRYALTGGLYSRNPERIQLAQRDFAVGNLYINRRITGSQVDAQPFGGFKLSGTGVKAGSPDYILHFMDARCITENTQRSGLVPGEADADASHRQNEAR